MTGFFENNTSANSTPTTDATVTTEASFYGTYPNGDPMTIAQPFEGVLQPGTAHIGEVSVSNFPSTVAITNFPGTQSVNVTNFPATQKVALDFPAVQAVNVLNLTQDQQVHGAVSITNWPSNQNVTLTGDSTVKALLLAGTSHIGSVSLDAPITGTVTVSNFPANQSVTVGNFPQTQTVNGTLSIANFPSSTKLDTSTPLDVWIRGSDVSLGDGSSTGGSLNGNVTVVNSASKPIPVQIIGGQSSFSGTLSSGTAHIGQVSIDQPVTISGTVPVSLVSVPTHGVTIQGTPSVQIANPITHLSIDNLPAVQAVQGTVAISNLPATQVVSGTVSIANMPATQVISGIVSLAANSAVQVSGKVQVDTSTPLMVTVTNPSSGGGSGSSTFDGNVTVSGGTLSGIANIVQVAGSVNATIDGVAQVYVMNPQTGAVQDSDGSGSIPVTGPGGSPVAVQMDTPVAVSSLPPISGAVSATISGTPTVSLASNVVTIGNTAANPVQVSLPDNAYFKTSGGAPAGLKVAITDYYGTQFGTSSTNPLQVQVAKNDPYTPVYVAPSGTFNVQLQQGGSTLSNTNAIPVQIVGGGSSGGSVSGTVSTIDGYTSVSIGSVSITSGGQFTTLSAAPAKVVEITNYTGTDLDYQRGGAGNVGVITTGMTKVFVGLTNASAIGLRRRDQSTTSLSISYDILN